MTYPTNHGRFISDQLEKGLRELQTVAPYDYEAAYRAALGGCSFLRPAKNETHALWLQGRCLALATWKKRMRDTLELRIATLELRSVAS